MAKKSQHRSPAKPEQHTLFDPVTQKDVPIPRTLDRPTLSHALLCLRLVLQEDDGQKARRVLVPCLYLLEPSQCLAMVTDVVGILETKMVEIGPCPPISTANLGDPRLTGERRKPPPPSNATP